MSEALARVTLKRLPRPLGDIGRTYKVFIDDRAVGAIRRKETKTFEVAPGKHRIHLEIDWCSSRRVSVELPPGQEVKLTCSARPPNSGLAVLNSSSYIVLDALDRTWLTTSPRPATPQAPVPAPGAPSDTELRVAWKAWSDASSRASELRHSLQDSIAAGDRAEADRLKREVRAVLSDDQRLAAEYRSMRAKRPDWAHSE
jgi:hypothetical protein